MVDFNRILSGLTRNGVAAGLAGGVAGGALTSALSSKKGRKTAATLLKLGGVAAVGGLAWNAYRNYRQQLAGGPAERQWQSLRAASFDVARNDALHAGQNSLLITRAMITAAMSDGHMDSAEQMRIFEHSHRLVLSKEDKAALFDELRNPQPLHMIVSAVDQPALAVEVYTASLLVIDELTFEGQTYLRRLALLLNLPDELVEAIHAEAEAEPQASQAA